MTNNFVHHLYCCFLSKCTLYKKACRISDRIVEKLFRDVILFRDIIQNRYDTCCSLPKLRPPLAPFYVECSMHYIKKSHHFEHVRYKWHLVLFFDYQRTWILLRDIIYIKGVSLLDRRRLIRFTSVTYCESQPTSQRACQNVVVYTDTREMVKVTPLFPSDMMHIDFATHKVAK